MRTTQAISTHQRDVWHVLHLATQVQARLERMVQEEEERGRLIERQEQQRASTSKKAVGRPAKTTASQQEQLLRQLHYVRDGVGSLFAQLRQLLEMVVLTQEHRPRLLGAASWREEVETVLDVLEEVGQSAPASVRKEVQRGSHARTSGPACPAALCRGTGSEPARGHCAVGRTGRGTHRLGMAAAGDSGQAAHRLA